MDSLPVYGPAHELLYDAPLSTVPRLIESGRVQPVGKNRVRALIATCGIAREDLLALAKLPAGVRFSHNHETEQNPKGVWTFRRVEAYG